MPAASIIEPKERTPTSNIVGNEGCVRDVEEVKAICVIVIPRIVFIEVTDGKQKRG
jgi:hypothetical protein